MALTRPTATAAEPGNRFNADSGIYASESNLTAWDNNTQIVIGGTGRTPIVINNGSLAAASTNWQAASVSGVDNASAFEIKFRTTGHKDIRFSASQKSTGSGPDTFKLAYRIGPTGPFIPIDNSTVTPPRLSNDTYSALGKTYDGFLLPAALNDQDEVYIRVYFDGITNLGRNGNTSINDIVIKGVALGDDEPVYGDVDGDGVIDAADITLLRRYIAANDKPAFLLANPRFNIDNARVTGHSGDPNAADVARLRQYVAGFPVTLGPSKPIVTLSLRPVLGTPAVLSAGQNVEFDFHISNPEKLPLANIGVVSFDFPENLFTWNWERILAFDPFATAEDYTIIAPETWPFFRPDAGQGGVSPIAGLEIMPSAQSSMSPKFLFQGLTDWTGTEGILVRFMLTTVAPVALSEVNIGVVVEEDSVSNFTTRHDFTVQNSNGAVSYAPPIYVQPGTYGDINGDGRIDWLDHLLLREWLIFPWPPNFDYTIADINGDGVVNSMDLLELRLWLLMTPAQRETFRLEPFNSHWKL
jgi:hypothetical protein